MNAISRELRPGTSVLNAACASPLRPGFNPWLPCFHGSDKIDTNRYGRSRPRNARCPFLIHIDRNLSVSAAPSFSLSVTSRRNIHSWIAMIHPKNVDLTARRFISSIRRGSASTMDRLRSSYSLPHSLLPILLPEWTSFALKFRRNPVKSRGIGTTARNIQNEGNSTHDYDPCVVCHPEERPIQNDISLRSCKRRETCRV